MINLSEEQLQVMSMMNKARLEFVKEFKSKDTPNMKRIFETSLELELTMIENMHTNNLTEMIAENTANLIVLTKSLAERNNSKRKQYNVKWRKNNEGQNVKEIPKEAKSVRFDDDFLIKKKNSRENFTNEKQLYNEKDKNKTMAEFISANSLPKGTSVRKKFVPPFKKPEITQLKDNQNEEQKQKSANPLYKNLDQKLVQIIQSQILQKDQKVKWNEIAGLGFAKKIIHEMIVWPMQRPDIFTGVRSPPRGILLFGPPGTGKTMIGRAIASEASATFFSISASSLTSKWVGQSEKLVKTLFTIARAKQPSVIFIDEIDSLLCARSQGEQQSSRRVKTQFLIELDGAKTNSNERVLIIGATNLPQQLDDAVRRRFVKRLYIPLPNLDGRIQLITTLTANSAFDVSQQQIRHLAEEVKGFSGADLYSLCSQASMIPLRELDSIQNLRNSEVPKTKLRHFQAALKLVRPSVNKKLLKTFQEFNEQYGSSQFSPDELEDNEIND